MTNTLSAQERDKHATLPQAPEPVAAVTVSVILPTYNRADSLKAACESVLSQSYRDLELIVVDDASTEDVMSVVKNLKDTRVRYVRHDTNTGVSKARNTGLTHARGSYVAFQDSDDLWLPGKLARQLTFFETLPADVGVVIGSKILYGRDADRTYGSGKVTCAPSPSQPLKLEEDQTRRFLESNRISLQNAVFRKDCFPGEEWFDPCAKANADWEFTSRLAQHTRIYEDPEPVVLAFVSDDSISTNFRKKGLGLARILKKNRLVLEEYPDVYARNLVKFASLTWRLGKKRTTRRLLLAALRRQPVATLCALASRIINKLA